VKNRNIYESFRHAWHGVRQTAARERNFRTHIYIGIAAVAACIVFRVETAQFIWVVFSIFFVLCMELFNTAVEALTDLLCGTKPHPLAKLAKDTAAAAVLLASLLAVIVAVTVAGTILARYIP
jgi:diacylglycerol kinase